jgi:hypothetical protein
MKTTHRKSRATRRRRPTSRQPCRPHDTRSRCTPNRKHHLPGPPSRRITTRARAATPHNPATRSPSCTGQTACRPRPPHQHPGPPPRPKSQTATTGTRRPSRQSFRPSDTRLSPKPSQATAAPQEAVDHHGSRGRRLDIQTSSARGRCPDIHQPDNERNTHQKLNMASKTKPPRRLRRNRRHRPPRSGTRDFSRRAKPHPRV